MTQQHPVLEILGRWPSRQAVLDDVRQGAPGLDLMAVHRMFQRRSVSPRHWAALSVGARQRGLMVSVEELAAAHAKAPEQVGHAMQHGNDQTAHKSREDKKVSADAPEHGGAA